ncbi:MAG: universal stress protein [Chitinophagales bacterium]|nr:universal stress protein [Chitinophagales bacterium]
MKNILVPSDFSSEADNALKYACNLAEIFDTGIDLLHVHDEEIEELTSEANAAVTSRTSAVLKETDLQVLVDEFKKRNDKFKAISINTHFSTGNVTDEVVKICNATSISIIVMGTKGSDSTDSAIGSVTSEVIKEAERPVLAVPKQAGYKPIKKVVYCIDYEGYDKPTINSLASFAGHFDAEIVVVHINSEPQYFDSSRWTNFQRMVNDAYDYENMRFEFLNHEDILKGIDEYIEGKDIDLIAMLTRNYHLLDRVFPSSMTRSMVLKTKIPLLAFHE